MSGAPPPEAAPDNNRTNTESNLATPTCSPAPLLPLTREISPDIDLEAHPELAISSAEEQQDTPNTAESDDNNKLPLMMITNVPALINASVHPAVAATISTQSLLPPKDIRVTTPPLAPSASDSQSIPMATTPSSRDLDDSDNPTQKARENLRLKFHHLHDRAAMNSFNSSGTVTSVVQEDSEDGIPAIITHSLDDGLLDDHNNNDDNDDRNLGGAIATAGNPDIGPVMSECMSSNTQHQETPSPSPQQKPAKGSTRGRPSARKPVSQHAAQGNLEEPCHGTRQHTQSTWTAAANQIGWSPSKPKSSK
ncbi:hypothetical protein ARMSODRAFT_983103 [Armillaria solidipes]|uniref:Uncharacterized protein n=1 Tax=Armillaria solidipes TaxID=1076256 RepID=A0A2H3B8I9_9AGAR|nr:hypothetical protein ARMSODRAFT_983103 [Armillaria solidipes]